MSLIDPLLVDASKNFSNLSKATSILNKASGELASAISQLDEMLQNLNIGLTAWITFRSRETESPEYDNDQLGYAKVSGKWGLAIQRIYGDPSQGQEDVVGPWLFNDASRELRLLAVDKIPELLELLANVAAKTAERVEEKTRHVRVVTSAVQTLAAEKASPKLPPYTAKAVDPGPPPAAPPPYKPATNPPSEVPPYARSARPPYAMPQPPPQAGPTKGKDGGK
jgi:hypothetical protein